jgi:hypothetical protein
LRFHFLSRESVGAADYRKQLFIRTFISESKGK